jgi:uncharacterized protein (TIGR03067 family)
MRRVLPLLIVLSLGFAPAPVYRGKPGGSKGDLQKMQGEWVRVSLTVDGAPQGGQATLSVKDDRMRFQADYDRWKVVLDATGSPPKIDFHHASSPNGRAALAGIYRLEADTRLTICVRFADEESERPVGFDHSQPNVWLHVYKRIKP